MKVIRPDKLEEVLIPTANDQITGARMIGRLTEKLSYLEGR